MTDILIKWVGSKVFIPIACLLLGILVTIGAVSAYNYHNLKKEVAQLTTDNAELKKNLQRSKDNEVTLSSALDDSNERVRSQAVDYEAKIKKMYEDNKEAEKTSQDMAHVS